MRLLYVVRWRDVNGNAKTYVTTAGSPEAAAKKLRKKGHVTGVRRKRKHD